MFYGEFLEKSKKKVTKMCMVMIKQMISLELNDILKIREN